MAGSPTRVDHGEKRREVSLDAVPLSNAKFLGKGRELCVFPLNELDSHASEISTTIENGATKYVE